jgi:hypothetical protein
VEQHSAPRVSSDGDDAPARNQVSTRPLYPRAPQPVDAHVCALKLCWHCRLLLQRTFGSLLEKPLDAEQVRMRGLLAGR